MKAVPIVVLQKKKRIFLFIINLIKIVLLSLRNKLYKMPKLKKKFKNSNKKAFTLKKNDLYNDMK